mmetsp:Transcript_6688/g.14303  ORF Transcript_6688/g.14303 Transcript_6688/m.14303 type:complete len:222 (+) Transcript_6688:1478-2143(+)
MSSRVAILSFLAPPVCTAFLSLSSRSVRAFLSASRSDFLWFSSSASRLSLLRISARSCILSSLRSCSNFSFSAIWASRCCSWASFCLSSACSALVAAPPPPEPCWTLTGACGGGPGGGAVGAAGFTGDSPFASIFFLEFAAFALPLLGSVCGGADGADASARSVPTALPSPSDPSPSPFRTVVFAAWGFSGSFSAASLPFFFFFFFLEVPSFSRISSSSNS